MHKSMFCWVKLATKICANVLLGLHVLVASMKLTEFLNPLLSEVELTLKTICKL